MLREKSYVKARWLQTAIAAVGLTFVAFLMFEEGFLGTPADWFKVFLWGFVADVGINSFVELARGQANPG